MRNKNLKKDIEFFKIFDKNQNAHEELKKYILGNITIVGDKKLKELLVRYRITSNDLWSFLDKKLS